MKRRKQFYPIIKNSQLLYSNLNKINTNKIINDINKHKNL